MKKVIWKFSFIALLGLAVACGTDQRSQNRTENSNEVAEEANDEKFDERDDRKDADFVAEQVAANYAEIEMAQLATQKATNPEVKTIARELETQHSKTLKELQTLASQKAISIPSEAENRAERKLDNMSEENDASDFNKEWTKDMVDKHEKKIEEYEDQLERTEDADLKAWITQTLPGLRAHLDKLKACNEKLKDA
jgi:putative membrane protein